MAFRISRRTREMALLCALLPLLLVFCLPFWIVILILAKLCRTLFRALPRPVRRKFLRSVSIPGLGAKAPPRRLGMAAPTEAEWTKGVGCELPGKDDHGGWTCNGYLGWAKQAGWKRVLMIGPGTSYEPDGLSRLGFEVTTIELSAEVARAAETARAKDWWRRLQLKKWTSVLIGGPFSGAVPAILHRPELPTSYTALVGDFLQHDGQYDIIATPMLGFYVENPEKVRAVAEKLVGMLNPGGLLVLEFFADRGARKMYCNALREMGLEVVNRHDLRAKIPQSARGWVYAADPNECRGGVKGQEGQKGLEGRVEATE